MNEPTIIITAIEYTINGRPRKRNLYVNFEGIALDALSCFVNAWANYEDEDFNHAFRAEMNAACDKAVRALNYRAYSDAEETA